MPIFPAAEPAIVACVTYRNAFSSFLLRLNKGVAGQGSSHRRGRKKKGLFHIVEIVIITMVMFVVIFQMSSMPNPEADWGKSRLTVQGRDILYSIIDSGADWSDENEIAGLVDDAFNGTNVKYSLVLSGAPEASISVGCLCDGSPDCHSFCDWLSGELPPPGGSLKFNGLPTGFTVTETSSINNLFGVMVDTQPLTGMDREVANYLSSGGGFVLVRNLSSQDFTDYGTTLSEYFAVSSSAGSGSGSVRFDLDCITEDPEYYQIPRYFSHISNGTGDRYNITNTFSSFSGDSAQKGPDPSCGVTILRTANGYPACIAREGASGGMGKTVWVSNDMSVQDDWSILLTSLVLWSSGHERQILSSDMGVEKAAVSIYMIPRNNTQSGYNHMFQPIEAILTLGYIY